MAKSVSARDAQRNLDEVLQTVRATREPMIIAREGEAIAVVITPADFERFLRLEAESDWEALDALAVRNADKDLDDAFADITSEIGAARQERRSTAKRSA
jgi:prevent-host-death family protein